MANYLKKKKCYTAMFPFCCVLYFWPNMFKLSHGNMESVFKSVKGSFAFRFTTLGEWQYVCNKERWWLWFWQNCRSSCRLTEPTHPLRWCHTGIKMGEQVGSRQKTGLGDRSMQFTKCFPFIFCLWNVSKLIPTRSSTSGQYAACL